MNSHRTITASASARATGERRLTRAERFAIIARERVSVAPLYKIGDRVRSESREGRVTDLHDGASGYLVTVVTYAGAVMVGEDHPSLEAVEA